MTYFADTFYFFAILNTADPAHARAQAFARLRQANILTTQYVLLELADAMCDSRNRVMVAELIRRTYLRPDVHVIPTDPAIFDEALNLYSHRPDKDWSLTDCTSFIIMKNHGLTQALTGDHHFEQAGFVALLK